MKKLKIILLFSLILLMFIVPHKSRYKDENKITGIINNYEIDGNKLTLELIGKERVLCYYYINSLEEKKSLDNKLKVGLKIDLYGNLIKPSKNKNFNLFNYKKYLLSKKIYWLFEINSIEIISKDIPLKYKIKNIIKARINKSKNSKYLNTFIIGDNQIDSDIKDIYRNNGVSHIFSISGMHISIFTSLLLIFLNKKKKTSYFFVFFFLIFYIFITNGNPSVIRSSLMFIFINIKKIFNFKVNNIEILLFILFLCLIYNPYYIYNTGFLYSFSISITLIIFSDKFSSNNYFKNIFLISLYSFIVSLPITINSYNSINLLSPLINVLYVPFISYIIFPLCLLNFVFLKLDFLVYLLIKLLEYISLLIGQIFFLNLTMCSINKFGVIIYYIIIIFVLKKIDIRRILFLLIIIIIHHNINYINIYPKITILDVNQGDSILITLPFNKNILIDTGGKINYYTDDWKKRKNTNCYAKNTIIPYLKSIGIEKIDYLITTHGDYDHMGEAKYLVEKFKVEQVVFNCGRYNDLEKELIRVLDRKNINYKSCINELNIGKSKLIFLQTGQYDNENDNSNVIYTEFNGYKFMFMGDASITTEKEILSKYNLSDIDVLKVGHHGSKTSSSKEFINEINPKYSIISVGKNNRYGHPNKEALDNLKDSKIYRTDIDGSIMFKIKNNKLKIETCGP